MPLDSANSIVRARPELLAPAGDADCLRAAIENGADAVYFGLETGFNARARATNFSLETLPEIMAGLHRRGVKGYVTLNTLVFPSELPEVERHARRIAEAGVDAVLVQDLGVARLLKELCPALALHASTQMTLTSAECINAAAPLGIERVVLARELSLEEIREIAAHTTMALEVFVHGALCVAYSGQCLTSESLGGRSANRGQCAQACRMPYELLCDGKLVDLGEQKYLLSPQDLAAYELIPELIAAGVASFKIEGRLKTAEYVANITSHYRRAIDAALANRPVGFTPRDVEEMELSFSRGFSPGWLEGCDHKRLVPALSSAKRGVLLGIVKSLPRGRVAVELRSSIKRGDGVVFEGDRAAGDEQGGRVFEVFRHGESLTDAVNSGIVELAFQHGALDRERLWIGQQLWKTDDPALTQRLRKTFSGDEAKRRMRITVEVVASAGEPLRILARTESGAVCQVVSDEPLERAKKHPLTEEVLREQFGRLGKTAFELGALTARITGEPMAPLSVLGALRHKLVEGLDAALAAPSARVVAADSPLVRLRSELPPRADSLPTGPANPPALHVLCRSLDQLREVLACEVPLPLSLLYADFQDLRDYREAVQLARSAGTPLFIAPPRIQKPGELGIFSLLAKVAPDGILVRNQAGLAWFGERGLPMIADYSLNVTNELTAQLLRERGPLRLTASYDLNREQLLDLVGAVPPEWLEVVIHQHMPMFHMEHCVFCAVLSPGTNKTNCGRPCDTHEVRLRDRVGMEHPLKADVGCRNTLYNATPQSAAEAVPTLLVHGIRHFRLELLDAPGETPTRRVIELYRRLLAGEVSGHEVWQQLRAANRVGVTRGTLEERRNPLAIL